MQNPEFEKGTGAKEKVDLIRPRAKKEGLETESLKQKGEVKSEVVL